MADINDAYDQTYSKDPNYVWDAPTATWKRRAKGDTSGSKTTTVQLKEKPKGPPQPLYWNNAAGPGYSINDGGQDVEMPTPEEMERRQLTDWIKSFTQSLGRPVDMNDPVFASLSNLGAARASMNVGASGVRVGRGGLGELAIQQGAMNAVQPYLQQRQQMLQQGLGMLAENQATNERLRQGAYGLNLQQQQMQNNINQQMYGQQADAAGGVGGAVGGFLGALGTAGLAAIPGVGPAIATAAGPGLIKGGSSIGAGFGMNSVQRPTFSSPRPYGSFGRNPGGYT